MRTRLLSVFATFLLALTSLAFVAGPANANGGYPDVDAIDCSATYGIYSWCKGGSWYSGRGYGYRNCTDYVAWKLESLGVSTSLTRGWGNGGQWNDSSSGVIINTMPAFGAAAVNESVAPPYGHVSFVESVNTNGTITISEYNYGTAGNYGMRTGTPTQLGITNFVHFGVTGGGGSAPTAGLTSSTEDAQYGGSFNADGYGDVTLLHQVADGGAGVHVLYGATGTPFTYPTTFAQQLPGTSGWDWTKMKIATGRFNSDSYTDVAILHQRVDGGADIHVMYGGAGTPFATVAPVRNLPASAGWNWSQMKLVSGDINSDGLDDLVVAHQLADGGAGIHAFYGGGGASMFANATTSVRNLPASAGWNWSQMKLAAGPFNNGNSADLAIFHQLADGGIGVHMLEGGATPFTNTSTSVRNLLASDGWDWTKIKLAAEPFNSDGYADLAILHKLADGGIGVHVLYGNPVPFADVSTAVRNLPASDGWDWTKIKLAAGAFNSDTYSDVALVHQTGDGGAGVHMLYGNPGASMFAIVAPVRNLPASDGWDWAQMKLAS